MKKDIWKVHFQNILELTELKYQSKTLKPWMLGCKEKEEVKVFQSYPRVGEKNAGSHLIKKVLSF